MRDPNSKLHKNPRKVEKLQKETSFKWFATSCENFMPSWFFRNWVRKFGIQVPKSFLASLPIACLCLISQLVAKISQLGTVALRSHFASLKIFAIDCENFATNCQKCWNLKSSCFRPDFVILRGVLAMRHWGIPGLTFLMCLNYEIAPKPGIFLQNPFSWIFMKNNWLALPTFNQIMIPNSPTYAKILKYAQKLTKIISIHLLGLTKH